MINETEVEMENYEEVIGNLDYTTSDQTGQNAKLVLVDPRVYRSCGAKKLSS